MPILPARSASPRLVTSLLLAAITAVTFVAGTGNAFAQSRGGERGDSAMRAAEDREARGADARGADARGSELGGHDRRADHRALSDAVRRVERRTGGQVLSAERVPFDGRDVNRVKVVDSSGRVRVYMDDPRAAVRAGDDDARRDPPRTRRDDD